ncbi:MAG: amidohydrolase family protein [Thaumarchaeota archaeon]|nr:amidohydrolase family protein [Candidatus Calditenuaceae archaeon]
MKDLVLIDVFNHIYPREFLQEYVRTRIPALVRFVKAEVEDEFRYFTDPEVRLMMMDNHGIEKQVVSLAGGSKLWEGLSERRALRLTRLANDTVADLCERFADRLIPAATLPRLEGEFIEELRRAVRDLGVKAVQVYTNVEGRPLDQFKDFFAEVERLRVPILLHPIEFQYYPWVYEYNIAQTLGWPFDTSVAVSRLVFSGILESYPNVKIITHHLGGMISFFAERIRGFYDEAVQYPRIYAGHTFLERPLARHPLDYFRSIYADTAVSGSAIALRCGIEFFGPSHVLFATDFPFGPDHGERWVAEIIRSLVSLGLPEGAIEDITHRNAERLLRL